MKKVWFCALLLGYCVPWTYFALLGDAKNGTMLLYGVMIAAFAVLCALCIGKKLGWIIPVGSIISGAGSLLCAASGVLADMGWYFKPFTAIGLIAVISVIALAAQSAVWAVFAAKARRAKDAKEDC